MGSSKWGRALIDFLKFHQLAICNGRFSECNNRFTYVSGRGQFAVDHCITNERMFGKVINIEILPMSEILMQYDIALQTIV